MATTLDEPTRMDMIAGDSFVMDVVITDDEQVPIDLTGASLFFSCKRQFNDSTYTVFAVSSVAGGFTVTSAVNGRATIAVPPSATETLTFPPKEDRITAHYDIELRQADGTITTLSYGPMVIHAAVTRV
jgi:hypothetical protein